MWPTFVDGRYCFTRLSQNHVRSYAVADGVEFTQLSVRHVRQQATVCHRKQRVVSFRESAITLRKVPDGKVCLFTMCSSRNGVEFPRRDTGGYLASAITWCALQQS